MKKEKQKERSTEEKISTVRRIFQVHGKFKWHITVQMIIIFLTMVSWSIRPWYIALIVDALIADKGWDGVTGPIIWFVSISLANMLLERFRWWYEVKYIDNQISDHVASITLRHLTTLSIGQHQHTNSLVTSSKISSGESAVRSFMGTLLYNLVPTFVMVLLALVAMSVTYPLVGMAASIFAAGMIWLGLWTGKHYATPVKRWMKFRHKVVGKSGGELVRHMGSIILADEDERSIARHMNHRRTRRRLFQRIFHPFGSMVSWGHLLTDVGRCVAIIITVYAVIQGWYAAGALAAIFPWLNQSLGQLNQTQRLYRAMTENWGDIETYFDIMDTVPAVERPEKGHKFSGIRGHIVFDGVVYAYPKSDNHALNGISLEIHPGQKIGIVGPSGAGKSTLLSMLQIADNPLLGDVFVDGVSLAATDHQTYRQNVAFVEQSPQLFDRSLRANMLFGLSQERRAILTDQDLEDALHKLNLDQLIPRLHSTTGEFGKKLSGGEKQRIAIARALLKQPDLLIVDEGTSSVDPVSERLIHKALEEVSPGITRIFVAHRLATVQNADKIFVIDKGCVIGEGTHHELLDTCEIYEGLVRTQMLKI